MINSKEASSIATKLSNNTDDNNSNTNNNNSIQSKPFIISQQSLSMKSIMKNIATDYTIGFGISSLIHFVWPFVYHQNFQMYRTYSFRKFSTKALLVGVPVGISYAITSPTPSFSLLFNKNGFLPTEKIGNVDVIESSLAAITLMHLFGPFYYTYMVEKIARVRRYGIGGGGGDGKKSTSFFKVKSAAFTTVNSLKYLPFTIPSSILVGICIIKPIHNFRVNNYLFYY